MRRCTRDARSSRLFAASSRYSDDRKEALGTLGAARRLLYGPLYTGRRLFDAGGPVTGRFLLERRYDRRARCVLRGMLATRMKYATGRRIGWRWNVAFQHDARL